MVEPYFPGPIELARHALGLGDPEDLGHVWLPLSVQEHFPKCGIPVVQCQLESAVQLGGVRQICAVGVLVEPRVREDAPHAEARHDVGDDLRVVMARSQEQLPVQWAVVCWRQYVFDVL